MMHRKLPLKNVSRHTVKSDKHNYTVMYDITFDHSTELYYITVLYMLNNNIDIQASVTCNVKKEYIRQISNSPNKYIEQFICSFVDGILRTLKQEFNDKFNISINCNNEKFIGFIDNLQVAINCIFDKI